MGRSGLTFPEYLAFKRGLRTLSPRPSSSANAEPQASPAVTDFVESLQGSVAFKVEVFVRIGVDSRDELDILAGLSEEARDGFFDMLVTEQGMSWSECKAVKKGLALRTTEGISKKLRTVVL